MDYERDNSGTLYTKLNGKYHSFNDRPAKIYTNGDQCWYKEGKLHRDSHFPGREDDLPAIISANGNQEWYKEGKLHRENDLPAIILANGDQFWLKDDKLHRDSHFPGREDDSPAIICGNGDRFWYKEGKQHRYGDLPAIIKIDGAAFWCVDDIITKYCANYILRVKSARNI